MGDESQAYVGKFTIDGDRVVHMYRDGDKLVEGDEPDEEPNDPPALFKSMREANERLARKASEREQSVKDREELLKAERIKSAFMLAASGAGVSKMADALRLADLSKAAVADDGTITGIDEVVQALVEDRPYLLGEAAPALDPERPLDPSGSPMNKNKNRARGGLDRASLEARYPALRNRR